MLNRDTLRLSAFYFIHFLLVFIFWFWNLLGFGWLFYVFHSFKGRKKKHLGCQRNTCEGRMRWKWRWAVFLKKVRNRKINVYVNRWCRILLDLYELTMRHLERKYVCKKQKKKNKGKRQEEKVCKNTEIKGVCVCV